MFVANDTYISKKKTELTTPPCGDSKYKTCLDCPNFKDEGFKLTCGLGYDISNKVSLSPFGEIVIK